MLAPELQTRVANLRAAPARAQADLRALVLSHLESARAAAATSPFVDLDRAEQVGAACLALLDAWPTLDEPARHDVQAACVYFADADDDEDDFASIVGFDDDAEVLNHIAERLGRRDLIIELDGC